MWIFNNRDVLEGTQCALEIRALGVQVIDEDVDGHTGVAGELPQDNGVGLHAADSADDEQSYVSDVEGPFDVDIEADEPGGVEEGQLVLTHPDWRHCDGE